MSDQNIQVVRGPINSEETVKALIEKTVEKFDRLDCIVNNAGAYEKPNCQADYFSMETYDYVFDVNLK